MQLSRPTLAMGLPPPPFESGPSAASGALIPASERYHLVHRPRSDPVIAKKKSIDMDLAYGDVPPDLASRVDLEPAHRHAESVEPEDPQEAQALTLMDRIEDFLEEAHCVHHTASSMIENLQRKPEAAAAVALSLAELSALVGKMSPAFLGFLKGGSPAVFALLASPQFLIGAGVAVGVTVVMFGGWKIVKNIKDSAIGTKTLEAPLEMRAVAAPPGAADRALPAPPAAGGGGSATGYDEALVLRDVEELSTIESWRRGVSFDDDGESADVELMSRAAERVLKEKHNRDLDEVKPCDSVSQVSQARSDRSRRSSRSHRSSGGRSQYSRRDREEDVDVPERRSSRKEKDGGASEAGSERSHRSHRSSRSHHHEGSSVSRSSKHSSKIGLKVIEEGDGDDSGSAAGKPKEKKRDMIKQLFKMKKDKEDRDRAVSVLV
jgi:hypothetical protein